MRRIQWLKTLRHVYYLCNHPNTILVRITKQCPVPCILLYRMPWGAQWKLIPKSQGSFSSVITSAGMHTFFSGLLKSGVMRFFVFCYIILNAAWCLLAVHCFLPSVSCIQIMPLFLKIYFSSFVVTLGPMWKSLFLIFLLLITIINSLEFLICMIIFM